jgi:hypothetical protein
MGPVDAWELAAREEIRDLVARYNANGDTGRFSQVLELFAPDAVMDLDDGRTFTGPDEILTIFTGTRDRSPGDPAYVRHFTATHQIDVESRSAATGRCYFQVLTDIGLDHWGRYVDRYVVVDGRWRFAHRRATVDGRSPGSRF